MKRYFYLILLIVIGLSAYQESVWSQDDFASDSRFHSRSGDFNRHLSESWRNRDFRLPPDDIRTLVLSDPRLSINGGFDCFTCGNRLAVDLSQSPVRILFSPAGIGYGVYLRWNNRPLVGDCPVAGTRLEEGSMMLDRNDGNVHPLRRYTPRAISWNLYDPAFEVIGSYYFQGCFVDHVSRQFTGDGSNHVQVDVVDKLPDLVLEADMFSHGPERGKGFIWVTEREFRSDLGGIPFEYKVYLRSGYRADTSPPAEVVLEGREMLVPGSGTHIVIPEGLIPQDGRHYTVLVSINESRFISESNYSNNFKAINWQFATPATLSFEKLRVIGNCDYRSPGEWIMMMSISSRGFNEDSWKVTYDRRDLDVEDNTSYPVDPSQKGFFNVDFANIPLGNTLEVRIGFEDCNSSTCGEEFRERFGPHDSTLTEWIVADLSPEKRRSGELVSKTSNNPEHCGFTAELKWMDTATARRDSYEAHARLRPHF